jgi:hypothetical protein
MAERMRSTFANKMSNWFVPSTSSHSPPGQVLLIADVLVRRDHQFESVAFRSRQQVAVGQFRPTQTRSVDGVMTGKKTCQTCGNVLVDQDPHAGCGACCLANAMIRRARSTPRPGKCSLASSSGLIPRSAFTTTPSARIRVPLTIGWPETLPGIRSTSSQPVQSISVGSVMVGTRVRVSPAVTHGEGQGHRQPFVTRRKALSSILTNAFAVYEGWAGCIITLSTLTGVRDSEMYSIGNRTSRGLPTFIARVTAHPSPMMQVAVSPSGVGRDEGLAGSGRSLAACLGLGRRGVRGTARPLCSADRRVAAHHSGIGASADDHVFPVSCCRKFGSASLSVEALV